MPDTYLTLAAPTKAVFTEKRSRFISFAIPVETREQVRQHIRRLTDEYHDARHVCYAYTLGADRSDTLASDNGEPSGSAGRPILGQITSVGLTNIMIAVVRYFGGVKLGVPGLIAAYKLAAKMAIEEGEIVEKINRSVATYLFPYEAMNSVMKLIKGTPQIEILSQQFDLTCSVTISLPASELPPFAQRITDIEGVTAPDPDPTPEDSF